MVLIVWMMMTMVLTRSYEGNLISLLTVRHITQPYQTLRDVVDDPKVGMVWQKQGSPIQAVIVRIGKHQRCTKDQLIQILSAFYNINLVLT